MTAKTIRNIDQESVHRICSGQVVLTLATAVKELVENSLDAGATNIEVRLKDYGQKSIEVVDNGSGIDDKNFAALTLKHHTSKLREFNDLTDLHTFGFRGEALSSLCALGDVNVVTRHTSADVATRLDFDHLGSIIRQSALARPTGTSVTVQNLFLTLAVRHKEFRRNIKREFAKMLQVLSAYAIISTRVRIKCTNLTDNRSLLYLQQSGTEKLQCKDKQMLLSTNGSETLRENLASIFGVKQVKSLEEFHQLPPSVDMCEEMNVKWTDESQVDFRVTGLVSRCVHGEGRSSADRQFYFVNQRPCDPSKIAKVVNEVYHTFNRHQYPTVVLDIVVNTDQLDVNVTPDKRKVFLNDEKLLLAVIKTSLLKMYVSTSNVYSINIPAPSQSAVIAPGVPHPTNTSVPTVHQAASGSPRPTLSSLKRAFSNAFRNDPDSASHDSLRSSITGESSPKQTKLSNYLDACRTAQAENTTSIVGATKDLNVQSSEKDAASMDFFSLQDADNSAICLEKLTDNLNDSDCQIILCSKCNDVKCVCQSNGVLVQSQTKCRACESTLCSCIAEELSHKNDLSSASRDVNSGVDKAALAIQTQSLEPTTFSSIDGELDKSFEAGVSDRGESSDVQKLSVMMNESTGKTTPPNQQIVVTYDDGENTEQCRRRSRQVQFSMEELKETFRNLKTPGLVEDCAFSRNFRAKISLDDNVAAEAELQREFHKDMFAKMEVIGQFNRGFIVAKLRDDMFIIDQHASDEKYNFEQLQATVTLDSQRLISPQRLELTASNETILMDNLHVFQKNGFDITVDENAAPTERLTLTSVPVSKNWMFSKADIEEMIFMLTESPGVMCRPSRIRQMFASRACRKSIMIGTALDQSDMKKVLQHMGDIEQPWNCPHGRPTMRHLINLRMLPSVT